MKIFTQKKNDKANLIDRQCFIVALVVARIPDLLSFSSIRLLWTLKLNLLLSFTPAH